MATGFELTFDLIQLHRDLRTDQRTGEINKHARPEIRCLVPGAFLTAFANGESRSAANSVRLAIKDADGHPHHLGKRDFVDAYAAAGYHLAARARVAPRGTGIWKWALLEGTELNDYLRDANAIRNRIAHVGSPVGARTRSKSLTREDGQSASVTLMAVEGVLQAAQDIAYMTASDAEREMWRWWLPWRTRTGAMAKNLARDPRFPLPG